jgi:3-oxoacyl-[acyl-carrier protein] reductase
MSKLLEGRVVLITGGSRGIGAATARLLAQHGAAIGVNYKKNQAAADGVVTEIEQAGGRALAVQADVADPAQVGRMLQEVQRAFGFIDTLVLNAEAITKHIWNPVVGYRWSDFEMMLTGEVKGVFVPFQLAVPAMLKEKRGCVVAVSSILSRQPRPGTCAHGAGKAALEALMRSMALELGPQGIRVNTVIPGLVETEALFMWTPERKAQVAQNTPLRKIANADDVANTILFLVSEHAGHITGASVPVNGGAMMN